MSAQSGKVLFKFGLYVKKRKVRKDRVSRVINRTGIQAPPGSTEGSPVCLQTKV